MELFSASEWNQCVITWCAWHNVWSRCNRLECGMSLKWSKRATDVLNVCNWLSLWFDSEIWTRKRAMSSFKFWKSFGNKTETKFASIDLNQNIRLWFAHHVDSCQLNCQRLIDNVLWNFAAVRLGGSSPPPYRPNAFATLQFYEPVQVHRFYFRPHRLIALWVQLFEPLLRSIPDMPFLLALTFVWCDRALHHVHSEITK